MGQPCLRLTNKMVMIELSPMGESSIHPTLRDQRQKISSLQYISSTASLFLAYFGFFEDMPADKVGVYEDIVHW
jgi:hypothetical protein